MTDDIAVNTEVTPPVPAFVMEWRRVYYESMRIRGLNSPPPVVIIVNEYEMEEYMDWVVRRYGEERAGLYYFKGIPLRADDLPRGKCLIVWDDEETDAGTT